MIKRAVFGAGCFWGVEYIFKRIPGVIKTEVGFMGGDLENPGYQDVCNGDTGHAEVIRIEFNNSKISYNKLLEVFFKCHDATQIDRQGPDIGNQYRSVIFYFDAEQKETAERFKERYEHEIKERVATKIEKASEFYRAEEYHQDYYGKNRGKPYCHVMPNVRFN